MNHLILFTLVSLALTFSCKTRTSDQSQQKAFEAIEKGPGTPIDFHLFKADLQKIPYTALSYTGVEPSSGETINLMDVRFDRLTKTQFAYLVFAYGDAAIGGGNSRVKYVAGKTYFLSDFLPPAMQALIFHNFWNEVKEVEQNERAAVTTNCWGTAYEMVRGAPDGQITLFYGDDVQILNLLRDYRFSTHVPSPDEKKIENPNAQFGDVILFLSGKDLVHATVYIDKNLQFEKAGYHTTSPYRLSIPEPELAADHFEFRRFKTGTRLPHPKDVMTSSLQDTKTGNSTAPEYPLFFYQVKMNYDANGKATLPLQSYTPQFGQEVMDAYQMPVQAPVPTPAPTPAPLPGPPAPGI